MVDSYVLNAALFLLSSLLTFYTYILVSRFILQLFKVDFFNPICQGIVRITDPPLNYLRRLIPISKNYDFAAIFLAFGLQFLYLAILPFLFQQSADILGLVFVAIANTLNKVLSFLTFSILAYVVLSWLSHGGYNPLLEVIKSISLPLLNRARKFLPQIAGLDFSPMLVIILLQLIIMLVIIPLRDFGRFSF